MVGGRGLDSSGRPHCQISVLVKIDEAGQSVGALQQTFQLSIESCFRVVWERGDGPNLSLQGRLPNLIVAAGVEPDCRQAKSIAARDLGLAHARLLYCFPSAAGFPPITLSGDVRLLSKS